MEMTTQEELYSLTDLGVKFRVPPHRVKYAIESRLIQPVRWIAGARIWSSRQLEQIGQAIADVGVSRINLSKGAATNAREAVQT